MLKKSFVEKLKVIFITLSFTLMFSCSSNEIENNDSTEKKPESFSTLKPATQAGTTYKSFLNLTLETSKKTGEILSNYIDTDSLTTRSGDSAELDTESIDALLPDDLTTLTRTVINRSGEDQTVTLAEELDQLAADFNAEIEKIKPDPVESAALPFVDLTNDGQSIVLYGDYVVNNNNLSGAVTIEFLNAQARGENIEDIVNDMNATSESMTAEFETDETEDTTRGTYQQTTDRWSDYKIYYHFSSISTEHKEEFKRAIADWEAGTDIRIYEYNSSNSWHKFLIDTQSKGCITVKDKNISASGNATVGYCSGWGGHIYIQEGLTGNGLIRTTRHELGHVFGLEHEHQRPDRDDYIEFGDKSVLSDSNYKKLTDYIRHDYMGWTWKTVKIRVWWGTYKIKVPAYCWQHWNEQINYKTSTYDYLSIMHYPTSSGNITVKKTQQGLNAGDRIPFNYHISDLDYKIVNDMY